MSSSEYRPQSLLGTTPYDALMAEAARRKRTYSDHPLAVELCCKTIKLREAFRSGTFRGTISDTMLEFLITSQGDLIQSFLLSIDPQYLFLLAPYIDKWCAEQGL